MAEIDVAALKEQVFGNGQPPTQTPEPPENKIPEDKPKETVEIKPAVTSVAEEKITTEKEEEAKQFDPNIFLKENLGYDSVEVAKAEIESLKLKANTPSEIKYANEKSRALHEAFLAGDEDKVYDILHEKRTLSAADSMKAADAIKLHIAKTHKEYKPIDVEDVFEEKYSYPEKPAEDDIDYDDKLIKYNAAVEKINRRIERDAATAKTELSKLSTELKLPEIQKTPTVDDAFESYKKEQELVSQMKEIDKREYAKISTKDVVMLFKFNDEASKLAFDIAYEPDKESFAKAVEEASDLEKFFNNYYGKDGSPDRNRLLKEIYAGRNIDKIVSAAVVQATNQTKAWFLKNQKNIGDGSQRNFVIPPTTDIEKLRQQVFG